jgi:GH25 family lysozyme M1 (1,4-beta-N-acetylmuramidase)
VTIPIADGPDTSHYQTYTGGPIPWPLHSLKCSEGKKSGDLTFPARWQMLRDRNIKYRGAYHWLRSDSSISDQAANLCARIDLTGGLLRGEFVQCDWETTPNIPVPTSGMAQEWCDRVQQHFGRECVIMYSSDWLPDSTLDADSRQEFLEWRDENPDFPYWHANYNTGDGSQGGWAECERYRADLWQWTSSFSHPSIVGRFDMNHVFNWATLKRITDQVPTPVAIPTPPEDDMAHKVIIEDALQGGAAFTLDFAPVSPEARAVLVVQGYQVVAQSHPHWTAACQVANGVQAAIMYEKFRDSRDGVAD